jgi:hypothetical protein
MLHPSVSALLCCLDADQGHLRYSNLRLRFPARAASKRVADQCGVGRPAAETCSPKAPRTARQRLCRAAGAINRPRQGGAPTFSEASKPACWVYSIVARVSSSLIDPGARMRSVSDCNFFAKGALTLAGIFEHLRWRWRFPSDQTDRKESTPAGSSMDVVYRLQALEIRSGYSRLWLGH